MSLRDFLLGAGADEDEGGCEANDSECGTSIHVAVVVTLSLGVSLSERHGTDMVLTGDLTEALSGSHVLGLRI